jgi:hypothetical protein
MSFSYMWQGEVNAMFIDWVFITTGRASRVFLGEHNLKRSKR